MIFLELVVQTHTEYHRRRWVVNIFRRQVLRQANAIDWRNADCVVFPLDISIRKWSALVYEIGSHAIVEYRPPSTWTWGKYSFVMKENYATNIIYELSVITSKSPRNFSQTPFLAPCQTLFQSNIKIGAIPDFWHLSTHLTHCTGGWWRPLWEFPSAVPSSPHRL